MERVDVAIAGAGIAGCLLARNLARLGHSVVVVEKNDRDAMGHDWWDTIDREVFAEVDFAAPVPPELLGDCKAGVVKPPLETIELSAPARPGLLHVDRKPLAQRQIKAAGEAGARLIFKTTVRGPVFEDNHIAGVTAQTGGGDPFEIRARLVVDASGIGGVIRGHIASPESGIINIVAPEDTFITHREIRETNSESDRNELVFGINNGVVWVNREQKGLIDFFAGYINFSNRPDPRKTIADLVARTPDGGGRVVRGGYGAPIPVRHCMDSFVAPHFVMCGDAACQCNPIDGSGIASSMRAAHLATPVIHTALENNNLDTAALWPYNAAYKRTQGLRFVALDGLQKFLVSEPRINLEVMFRRGVIRTEEFWGKGEMKSGGAADKITKMLKLIDRPRFIGRLAAAMGLVSSLVEHYQNYPEKYDPAGFASWQQKKRDLFNAIPRFADPNTM